MLGSIVPTPSPARSRATSAARGCHSRPTRTRAARTPGRAREASREAAADAHAVPTHPSRSRGAFQSPPTPPCRCSPIVRGEIGMQGPCPGNQQSPSSGEPQPHARHLPPSLPGSCCRMAAQPSPACSQRAASPEPATALGKPAHNASDSGVIGTLPRLGVNGAGVRGLAGHSLAQHPRGPTDLCVRHVSRGRKCCSPVHF